MVKLSFKLWLKYITRLTKFTLLCKQNARWIYACTMRYNVQNSIDNVKLSDDTYTGNQSPIVEAAL